MARERGLAFVIAVAAGWALLDAFFFGQGLIALILCAVAIVYLLPRAFAARRDAALLRLRFAKAAATMLLGAVAIAAIAYGNMVAEERAQALIAAVERFRAAHGRYPERLDELVPAFVAYVPTAKPVWMAARFTSLASASRHSLMYAAVPPFGRRVYSFEDAKWSYLD